MNDSSIEHNKIILSDILCQPIKNVFNESGINLIVFEVDGFELDSDIRLVCHPNMFKTQKFTRTRSLNTIVLMKHNNHFEPITTTLPSHKTKYIPNFMNEFPLLQRNIEHISNDPSLCGKLYNHPNELNMDAVTTIKALERDGFKILNQILYFNNQIVGYTVLHNGNKMFFPMKTSNIEKDIPIILYDMKSVAEKFETTIANLTYMQNNTPSTPTLFKTIKSVVVDNNHTGDLIVVGIKTKDNVFVPVFPFTKYINEDKYDVERNTEINLSTTNLYDEVIVSNNKNNKVGVNAELDVLDKQNLLYEEILHHLRDELSMVSNRGLLTEIKYIMTVIELSYNLKLNKIFKLLEKHKSSLFTKRVKKISSEILYRLSDDILRNEQLKYFLFVQDRYILFNVLPQRHKDEIIIPQSFLAARKQVVDKKGELIIQQPFIQNSTYTTSLRETSDIDLDKYKLRTYDIKAISKSNRYKSIKTKKIICRKGTRKYRRCIPENSNSDDIRMICQVNPSTKCKENESDTTQCIEKDKIKELTERCKEAKQKS